ncbi:phosphomannomutase/phosphoglucomutase [Sphingomonas sp. SUN019]|uniref:phosphoglucomutase/phosphomannomutase PgmG n=1 Tax=Sphingomonas sp. SUN019 TaxID=2937788 RepID=UPI002164B34B|nr:phosphomannomutase/phosphoglucomutase [Sphingomonas sp. SUN019]UVO50868.1 phosphomannomutase/phosphoglucomutase [Sphingomonas sp. SUN019]
MTHDLNPSILREYDIRGIVGETLDASDAHAVGRAFATIVRRAGGRRVVVGYDGRTSSPMLEAALVDGLAASGADVVRIGIGPSPMLYFAESTLEVDAGIQVTGSHNPRDHNGFKLVLQRAPFFGADIQALAALAAAGDFTDGEGIVSDADTGDAYVARLLAGHDGPGLRIGWDAGNGAAGPVVEALTKLLPGEHHLLFTDVDGDFPNHHPDPTEDENLADLQRLVAERRLDFGVAFDGDGDRIGAVDGSGRVLRGDQILSVLAESLLVERPGSTIIADVKASNGLFDRIEALGGRAVMWKSGHSNIKLKLREENAALAGEMSGHIFFGDLGGFDDGIYAAVRLIDAVQRSGRTLAEWRDAKPVRASTPELRFAVDPARKDAVVDEVVARLAANGATVDLTDGARVTTADGWWLLRASNTQDMLTARAEADDPAALDRLVAAIDAQLAQSGVTRAA